MISLNDQIERALQAFLPGAKLLRTWPLLGGISAQMTAFEIELPNQTRKKLIARQPADSGSHDRANAAKNEFRLLKILRLVGLPVPTPCFLAEAGAEVPKPFFVIEHIDGDPVIDPKDVGGYLTRYASQLVQIHSVSRAALDHSHFRRQTKGFGPRPAVPNDALDESRIRNALESSFTKIHSNPAVLRHGDFWPGNALWRNEEIVGVIDWEEALIGEPLADLSISRLDILWILGKDAMEEFTERYQSGMPLDYSGLAYWDLCASLRPITNLHEWAAAYPQLGRSDITEETMRRHHQWFAEQALARL